MYFPDFSAKKLGAYDTQEQNMTTPFFFQQHASPYWE